MLKIAPFAGKYRTGFTVEGHAEYAEHGADIVCSAVSAMTQMTLASLMRYSTITSNVESGNMSVHIHAPNAYTNCLMESLMRGLRMIELSKSQYVHIDEEKQYDKTTRI
jgi:uncharacterized protein YsxB (DUF464 family)